MAKGGHKVWITAALALLAGLSAAAVAQDLDHIPGHFEGEGLVQTRTDRP